MEQSPSQDNQTVDAQELYISEQEGSIRFKRQVLLDKCPIPGEDVLNNLGLFLNSKNLGRILFMQHIYSLILNTHGVVMDFGTRYGQNMSLFMAMRGLFEPYHRQRKIIGFDTFVGFPEGDGGLTSQDNLNSSFARSGALATPKLYVDYLRSVLELQEQDNPMSHVRRFEVVEGDACETVKSYLEKNPETIIALAYFDFDIYKPTKEVLQLIKDRLPIGAVVAFDELCDHDSPGETQALMEVFGVDKIRLKRLPFVSRVSYFIKGE